MRNQGKNRRSRAQRENDEDQFNAVREETHTKSSYTRHQHSSRYGESHRNASSTSSRMGYDLGRDRNVESSRNLRDDGWGLGAVGHERFDYGTYHHGEHDGYDSTIRRDPEGWRGNGEGQYSSRGDWSASYHQSEPSTSYPESSNWNAATAPNQYPGMSSPTHMSRSIGSPYRTPTPYYDDARSPGRYDSSRGYYHEHDQWSQRDVREPLPEDRIEYTHTEKHRNQGWKRENRREKGASQQKFQSDAGWSTRKKGKEWNNDSQSRWDEHPPEQHDIVPTEIVPSEDRSWEPAESWKSGARTTESSKGNQQQQREGGRQSQKSNKQQKSSRRQQSNKQKRDWRTDDSNLNKWVAYFLFGISFFIF